MNKFSKRIAAAAVIGAVVFGGLTTAQAANADVITGGVITLHGPKTNSTTIGPVVTSGLISDVPAFYGITTDQGCPVGFRGRSDTVAYQNNVKIGAVATKRDSSTVSYGNTGLDGNPIAMDDTYSAPSVNPFVANTSFDSFPTLASGQLEIRLYCSAVSSSINYTTDRYFSLVLNVNVTTGAWSVYTPPVAKTTPTVSLTGLAQADKSVLLSGTVKDGANPASAAVGSVKFVDTTPTTPVTLGSPTANSGVASFTTPVLSVGTYTYTAQFINNNDPKYGDSLVSGTVTVVVSANATVITVGIPAVGTVTLTGVASSVNLGLAALNSGLLTATGTLPSVTVTDTRNLGSSSWSLTGITTDFSTAGGVKLDGKYLGWVPTTSDSATNAGTIGANVAPGASGLKTASVLAYGSVVDQKLTTKVGATLNLAAPANTPVGTYNATLTLTLV